MQVYVGDTRSKTLLARCRHEGWGQIIIRGRLKGRRLDKWAYDNGAFEDWRAKRPFDGEKFLADLREIRTSDMPRPDFLVLPDKVAAADSLTFSMVWKRAIRAEGLDIAPLYLAVQDGMEPDAIPWRAVAGIFIGGTLEWKTKSAPSWARAARALGKRCHYARCGGTRRVCHAVALGVDSIDSCLPMWSKENLRRFSDALKQRPMFME